MAAASLDRMPVDVDFVDVPIPDALQVVGRRVGAQAVKVGSIWYLGTLLQEDRGLLVAKVTRFGGDELKTFVGVMLSDIGKSACSADGVVVVADRVEVLARISAAFDRLETCPSDAWVVQLYVIGVSDAMAHDLGIDGAPTASLSATTISGSLGNKDAWQTVFGVNGALKTTATNRAVNLVAEPTLVLVNGEPGEYQRGRRVPVARRTVSDSGTVSTAGFDYVDTGFLIRCLIRDVGQGRARLDMTYRDSAIVGYVGEVPIVDEEKANGSMFMESARLALVCSVKRDRQDEESGGFLGMRLTGGHDRQRLMIWCIGYRTR